MIELQEKNSTHEVEVVPVILEKFPDPETTNLSLVKIFDSYSYVARSEDWQGIDRAAYIVPDSLVDTTRPEFSWLSADAKFYADGHTNKTVARNERPTFARIRAKKIRGVISYGLLVPLSFEAELGEDVAEKLGVLHWNLPDGEGGEATKGINIGSNENTSAPPVYTVKYDLESFMRYAKEIYEPGEKLFITEKVEGENSRHTFVDGNFFCGSRNFWKREFSSLPSIDKIVEEMKRQECSEEKIEEVKTKLTLRASQPPTPNKWWAALRKQPALMEFLTRHPNWVVYSELCGHIKGFHYNISNPPILKVFDILSPTGWLSPVEAREIAPDLDWVPTIAEDFPFDFEKLIELAQQPSKLADGKHIAEGIVISPMEESCHPKLGRKKLKLVSNAYLLYKNK